MAIKPAIVVSAFNRPASLQRLLHSLQQAVYSLPAVPLVISIDQSASSAVEQMATAFEWPHGEKKIITHQQHLGLKAHILACGDLSAHYDAIIVLEDDLVVSPWFYEYALQALDAYAQDEGIAGISLYNYEVAENGLRPFKAIDDGSDVYFMQVASSWGQVWTQRQWSDFRAWLATHETLDFNLPLPGYLRDWGEHSWKKHFIHYLVHSNTYFVFPRLSLSTNFEEPGTNSDRNGRYQSSLQLHQKSYQFKGLARSEAVYDAWFEITPQCLNKLNPALAGYSYTVDLYSTKNLWQITTEYLLSLRERTQNAALSFDARLTPPEANVVLNLSGKSIALHRIADVLINATAVSIKKEIDPAPDFSVVIPVVSFQPDDLLGTLRSVDLQKQRADCVIACAKGLAPQIEALISGLPINTIIVKAAEGTPHDILLYLGLKQARQAMITWMRPGTLLSKDAFNTAENIFYNYNHISWIRGINESCNSEAEYSRVRTLPYRLVRSEVYDRLSKNTLDITTELQFFRKSSIENCLPKEFTQFSFFFELISGYEQHVAVIKLGQTQHNIKSSLINPAEQQALLARYAHFKHKVRLSSALINLILKTPPFNDGAWQWYLPVLRHFPDVLRFDAKHNTFYLSRY